GRWSVATPEDAQAILAAADAAPAVEATAPPAEAEGADAPEAPDQPAEDNPLTRLRADLTRIEHELLALDALKLPKFLQIQNLLWPALLLGGAAAGALGALTPVGWTVACVVGAIVALGAGIGAYVGLGSMARPQVIRHAVPIRKALDDAEQ